MTTDLDYTYLTDPAAFQAKQAGTTMVMRGQVVPADADLTPRLLSVAEIRRVGALTVQEETTVNTDHFLAEQRKVYAASSRADLEEELLRRDKNALLEGRQLQDGRLAGNLLRELMRHLLHTADHAVLGQLVRDTSKDASIDKILEQLGAAPADKRLLREAGTTLGTGQTGAERAAEFEGLASGEIAHTGDRTTGRPDVAQAIRDKRERLIPTQVKE